MDPYHRAPSPYHRASSPYRAPSPYHQPSPNTLAQSLPPTNNGQIAPGQITYTTTIGPDGKTVYHPFKCVFSFTPYPPLQISFRSKGCPRKVILSAIKMWRFSLTQLFCTQLPDPERCSEWYPMGSGRSHPDPAYKRRPSQPSKLDRSAAFHRFID